MRFIWRSGKRWRMGPTVPGTAASENTLVKEFDCSRNTIRRAIGQLASEGYVQSIHGKGVRIIYQPDSSSRSSYWAA